MSTSRKLVHVATPSTLLITDKPLAQGGKFKNLSKGEIEKKFDFTFDESLYASSGVSDETIRTIAENITNTPHPPSHKTFKKEDIEHRLQHPFENIGLCDMGEDVGWGIVAIQDIPENTILFFFNGKILDKQGAPNEVDYAYGYARTALPVDPKKRGGIARFMQHLPMNWDRNEEEMIENLCRMPQFRHLPKETVRTYCQDMNKSFRQNDTELEHVTFETGLKEKLASSNVAFSTYLHHGIPLNVVHIEHPIKAGDIIGFSYGKYYWRNRGSWPKYFTRQGKIIVPDKYRVQLPEGFNQPTLKTPTFVSIERQPTIYADNNPNTIFSGKKPKDLYATARQFYQTQKYSEAIPYFIKAVELFMAQKKEKNAAQSHLGMALCYQAEKNIDNSIKSFIKALSTFSADTQSTLYPMNLEKLKKIYLENKIEPEKIYTTSVEENKNKRFQFSYDLAKIALQAFQIKFTGVTTKEMIICRSTMISALRELGQLEQAKEDCEILLEESKRSLGAKDATTEKIKNKLDDIIKLSEISEKPSFK